jgi:hypothetical protein
MNGSTRIDLSNLSTLFGGKPSRVQKSASSPRSTPAPVRKTSQAPAITKAVHIDIDLSRVFKRASPPSTPAGTSKAVASPPAAPVKVPPAPVQKTAIPAPAPAAGTVSIRKADYDAMVGELATFRTQAKTRKAEQDEAAQLRDRLEKALAKIEEQGEALALLRLTNGQQQVEKGEGGEDFNSVLLRKGLGATDARFTRDRTGYDHRIQI